MSGTIPLLPLYAYIAWTGTSLLYARNLKMRNDKIAKVKKCSNPQHMPFCALGSQYHTH
jgi:hypothetical protein